MLKLLFATGLCLSSLLAFSQVSNEYAYKLGNAFVQAKPHIGLSIGIIQGNVQHSYNYGSVTRLHYSPPTSNTIYEIGSVTKAFTGILLAHAVMEGKLRLQDDIRKYIDTPYTSWISNTDTVRIINLANHTAGLPKNIPAFKNANPQQIIKDFEGITEEAFLKQLSGVKASTKPGTQYSYSNAGVQLLSIILSNVYKQSYNKLVEKYITGPLHMNDTRLTINPADSERLVTGYDNTGNAMPQVDMWKAIPAAGYLKSTTNDLLKFLQANMDMANDTLMLAQQPTFTHTDEDGDDIGLYWFIHKRQDGYIQVGHAGGTFGCTAYCLMIPKLKTGIVCLANDAAPGTEHALKQLAANLMNELVKQVKDK